MSTSDFWLWTLLFALISAFVARALCMCPCYAPRNRGYYISLLKKPIPLHTYKTNYVNKIEP